MCFSIQGQMAVNVLKISPLLFLKLMVGDLARLLVCGTKPIKVRRQLYQSPGWLIRAELQLKVYCLEYCLRVKVCSFT